MKPYALDRREKILRADDAHRGSQRALAALFGVSRAFVEKLVQQRRSTGQMAPRPHAGGRKPSDDHAALAVVRQGLQEHTDATLAELCERLGQRRGLWVRVSTMSRLRTRLGLPRKKSRSTPWSVTRRGSSRRARDWRMIAALDARRLKFIDESGVNLAMTRRYGRAPKGARVVGTVPQHDGQNVTRLGTLGAHGLQAVMTVEGPMDTAVFRAYIKQVLGPTLTPGDIVVLDNLGVHKARGIQQMLARHRVRLLSWPPTRQIWRRSSPAGRRSTRRCAEPKHAPAVLSTALSPVSCRP